MSPWWTLLGMGLVTVTVRVLPLLLVERVTLPETVQRGLAFVPVAVLSAIIAQEVVVPGGSFAVDPGSARVGAAVVAGLVAWRTRNVLATVGAGIGVLWLLEAMG